MMGSRDRQKQLWSYRVNLDKRVRSDHPLRKFNELLELDFVREEVANFYGTKGNVSEDPAASSTALLNPEVPSFVLDESTRNCRAVLRSMSRWPGLKTRHQLDDSTSDLSAPEFSPSSVAAGRNAYLQNASHVSGLSASTNAHIWDRSISTEGSQFRDVRFAFLLPAKFDWLAPNVPRSRR